MKSSRYELVLTSGTPILRYGGTGEQVEAVIAEAHGCHRVILSSTFRAAKQGRLLALAWGELQIARPEVGLPPLAHNNFLRRYKKHLIEADIAELGARAHH